MGQTAVEWFRDQLEFDESVSIDNIEDLVEQAKEMEKQNLYNFYMQGGVDAIFESDRTVEDYFNETFKSE